MRLGYNTNGLAHHRLEDAIALLAELGYEYVAITIDHNVIDPTRPGWQQQLEQVRGWLNSAGLKSVIETGARFLLDPRRKHQPTLIHPDAEGRQRRLDFLRSAILIAKGLNSHCVSIWSGTSIDQPPTDVLWSRLIASLDELLDFAEQHEVFVAFEPEPGMFIDTMDKFAELNARLDRSSLRLTLDIGHLHCLGEVPLADQIAAWAEPLVNVHIEDMRAGVHQHLMFGEGEIDFAAVAKALRKIHYDGPVTVELSRHSHMGPTAAQQALEFLRNHWHSSADDAE